MIEPTSFEKEELVDVPVAGIRCRVISGYANFVSEDPNEHDGPTPASNAPKGHADSDAQWVAHEVHMVVGPEWRAVRQVSPSVNLAGYAFDDSDEADDSGYHIDTCTWDTIEVPSFLPPAVRIRLLVTLRVRGGQGFGVTKLSYQLVAIGVVAG